jgi:hypothetical protein
MNLQKNIDSRVVTALGSAEEPPPPPLPRCPRPALKIGRYAPYRILAARRAKHCSSRLRCDSSVLDRERGLHRVPTLRAGPSATQGYRATACAVTASRTRSVEGDGGSFSPKFCDAIGAPTKWGNALQPEAAIQRSGIAAQDRRSVLCTARAEHAITSVASDPQVWARPPGQRGRSDSEAARLSIFTSLIFIR